MTKAIIVGNGASVLESKIGKAIDSFDKVIRLNDFQIKGYEEHVGTKTDILFTCRLNEYNSPERIAVFPEVILSLLMNPLDGVTISQEMLESPNISYCLGWGYVNQVAVNAGIFQPFYPSTGLICIHFMIHHGYDVTITGFDNFKNGNRHYYQEGDRQAPPRHNGEAELNYINLLIKQGKLKTL